MKPARLLIVDDEERMRRVLELMLARLGYEVVTADNGRAALDLLEQTSVDLILTDLRMPEMDGLALLQALRARGDETPAIVITAYGTVETAVAAMKQGASDYIIRPFEKETVELAIQRALSFGQVQRENRFLRQEVASGWEDFVGETPVMQQMYEAIRQVAPTTANVLITGETGTGKELVARSIHQASDRAGLFVPINCAAIPEDMMEAELFGHVKGAFTGATRDRQGKFELADGGTLFLDEITEMPLHLQPKLLRVLQERTVERVGSNQSRPIDIRVVAATNRDPRAAIGEGRLREDLYYRLNVFHVPVPALRERRDDIPLLVRHFIGRLDPRLAQSPQAVTPAAMERLLAYDWPGNVRELGNLVERALVLAQGRPIDCHHLPAELGRSQDRPDAGGTEVASLAMQPRVEALERELIGQALARSGGNKAAAARLLEISERSLWYRLKKYGID